MNCKLLITICIALLLSSCLAHRMGMYLRPVNAETSPYHNIPFRSDSIKKAIYASLIYTAGAADDKGRDWVHAGQANIYRAHNLGNFQAWYGLNLSLGNYHVTEFYNSHYTPGPPSISGGDIAIDTFYHIPSKPYFFGSYGLSGAINGVKSSGHKEWRWLGLEINMQKEFGNYYAFRKNLVDSAANIIFKNNLTGTIGIYTDAMWSNKYHTQFGFKFALNMIVNSKNEYTIQNTYSIFPVTCFSITYHVAVKQFSGFMQGNFGTRAASFQVGTSFRLTK